MRKICVRLVYLKKWKVHSINYFPLLQIHMLQRKYFCFLSNFQEIKQACAVRNKNMRNLALKDINKIIKYKYIYKSKKINKLSALSDQKFQTTSWLGN